METFTHHRTELISDQVYYPIMDTETKSDIGWGAGFLKEEKTGLWLWVIYKVGQTEAEVQSYSRFLTSQDAVESCNHFLKRMSNHKHTLAI